MVFVVLFVIVGRFGFFDGLGFVVFIGFEVDDGGGEEVGVGDWGGRVEG